MKSVPEVVECSVVGPNTARLRFSDGLVSTLDLAPALHGPVFEALRQPERFREVAVDRGTLVWPNGADICPSVLRYWCELGRVCTQEELDAHFAASQVVTSAPLEVAEVRGGLETVIVIPCLNESKRLSLQSFASFVAKHPDIGFCFVDDGSTDNTLTLLNKFQEENTKTVLVINLKRNRGKAEAIRAGVVELLKNTNIKLLGYWDADLATPLEEITRMQKMFQSNQHLQIVLGSRVKLLGYDVVRIALRHYIGRVFATAASMLLGMPVYDTQCGAKMFRREVAGYVFKDTWLTTWIFDVELLLRFKFWLTKIKRISPQDLDIYINEMPLLSWQEYHGSKVKWQHYFAATMDFMKLIHVKIFERTPREFALAAAARGAGREEGLTNDNQQE